MGKAVARRAVGFGMRILGSDPKDVAALAPDFVNETGIQLVDQSTLLHEADFISVNCDLNPTSYHLINAETLAQTKPSAVVINTARGSIVDEQALIHALQAGGIAGAALDVFEHEPLPEDSPLRQMNNVLLAPHNSNSSPMAWEHVHLSTINNLLAVLQASVQVADER